MPILLPPTDATSEATAPDESRPLPALFRANTESTTSVSSTPAGEVVAEVASWERFTLTGEDARDEGGTVWAEIELAGQRVWIEKRWIAAVPRIHFTPDTVNGVHLEDREYDEKMERLFGPRAPGGFYLYPFIDFVSLGAQTSDWDIYLGGSTPETPLFSAFEVSVEGIGTFPFDFPSTAERLFWFVSGEGGERKDCYPSRICIERSLLPMDAETEVSGVSRTDGPIGQVRVLSRTASNSGSSYVEVSAFERGQTLELVSWHAGSSGLRASVIDPESRALVSVPATAIERIGNTPGPVRRWSCRSRSDDLPDDKWADIVRAEATLDDETLEVEIEVAGPPPLASTVHEPFWGFYLGPPARGPNTGFINESGFQLSAYQYQHGLEFELFDFATDQISRNVISGERRGNSITMWIDRAELVGPLDLEGPMEAVVLSESGLYPESEDECGGTVRTPSAVE